MCMGAVSLNAAAYLNVLFFMIDYDADLKS